MARRGREGCFSHNTWWLLILNSKNTTESNASQPRGISRWATNVFMSQKNTLKSYNKAMPSTTIRQMCHGMEEWKSPIFFLPCFSLEEPFPPLSLCLPSDERLKECCSARPEATRCMQKVTETALAFWIAWIIHRYTAWNPHTPNWRFNVHYYSLTLTLINYVIHSSIQLSQVVINLNIILYV